MESQRDNPARPLGGLDELDDQARAGIGGPDDGNSMPAHEIDEDDSVGGGVMSQGGTAIDRGTGSISGQAQDKSGGDEDGDNGALGVPIGADDE
jgi:hypothetical protein